MPWGRSAPPRGEDDVVGVLPVLSAEANDSGGTTGGGTSIWIYSPEVELLSLTPDRSVTVDPGPALGPGIAGALRWDPEVVSETSSVPSLLDIACRRVST